ncbi:MAG: DUF4369 domain-containing protein [Bacteroidaceae bacterium]|nr:DUF4369 domain-containing protein [Bacteroidaceae bacterium]
MRKIFIVAVAAITLLIVACNRAPQFTIEGTIANADSTTLYLENITGNNPVLVDSVSLDEKGNFKFTHAVPEHAQFYRLRLGNQSINLVVDTVAHIICNSQAQAFATNYTVAGSEECVVMREVAINGARLKALVNQAMNNESLRVEALDSIAMYKARMTELVLQAPSSAVSYYILMQRVNGLPIFDTYDYADNRVIAAAATAHDIYAPDAPRTEILRNIALQGMAARREEQKQSLEIEASEIAYIDVELYDLVGNMRKLSEVVAQNKVVLLDFTAYALDHSPAYNIELNNIYEQYNKRGLEIYQVSFDTDLNRWQTVADNLPWVCVLEADNVQSALISLYDVQSLPTCYIIVDNGLQLIRPESMEDMKKKLSQIIG